MSKLQQFLRLTDQKQSHALIDAINVPNLYARLEALDSPFVSLLNGWSSTSYLRVAPFLVKIDGICPRLELLIEDAASASAMVWLESNHPIERIRSRLFKFYYWRHGRHHVYARIADAMYFSSFMKVLNEDQAKLLGTVAPRFLVPSGDNSIEFFQYDDALCRFVNKEAEIV
ncbi:DUF4123 domain-containing protein [Agrobacterium vitis]|uniref:DUF4123 domain-containing protein n=1 Tax=Agrobacterium vitis TaxID=373 RepID=UPI0015D729EE|nr:DUF4123 domain-containing protein [Agrobacterium vitis]